MAGCSSNCYYGEIPCIVQKRKVTVKDFFNKFEKNFNGKLHLFVQCKYLSLKTERFHKDYFPKNYRKFTEFAMCTWNYNTKICICLLFHDVYLTIDFFGHWNLIMLTVSKTGFFANIAKVFSWLNMSLRICNILMELYIMNKSWKIKNPEECVEWKKEVLHKFLCKLNLFGETYLNCWVLMKNKKLHSR